MLLCMLRVLLFTGKGSGREKNERRSVFVKEGSERKTLTERNPLGANKLLFFAPHSFLIPLSLEEAVAE